MMISQERPGIPSIENGGKRERASPLVFPAEIDEASSTAASSTEGRAQPSLAAEFNYVPEESRPYPPAVTWLRDRLFRIFLIMAFGFSAIFLTTTYFTMQNRIDRMLFFHYDPQWAKLVKYFSIPLVSIIFTWWHVWLGIKMCFYPVEFVGCCKPVLGWQGIVPRRAHVMAERSCDIMIGTLITIEEIIDRIEPDDFFESLEPVLATTSSMVVTRLANKYCPEIWKKLPDMAKSELQKKVMEESRSMFHPVVSDLKKNINKIVDIKQMSIDVLVNNKPLLVAMFQEIGSREFTFIQHVAAVMGFILGCLQLVLWIGLEYTSDKKCGGDDGDKSQFKCWGGFVILPVSGLIIGYFTNWLGIQMIFRPVEPRFCCWRYVKIQGVFLKRQQEVSKQLATMICRHLVHARQMLEYIVQQQEIVDKILVIYQNHMNGAFERVMGSANYVIPRLVGRDAIDGIKQTVINETLDELPNHSRQIEAYMDKTFGLEETLSYRLSRLHPARFEGMLHPVFQEDEWMVLLLGGVLGVFVGLLQALALGS